MKKEEFYRRVQENPNGPEAQLLGQYIDYVLMKTGVLTKNDLHNLHMGSPIEPKLHLRQVFDPATGLPIEW